MGLFGRRKYKGFKKRSYKKGYVKTGGGHKSSGFLTGMFKKKNKNKIGGSPNDGNVAVHSPRVGYGPNIYSNKEFTKLTKK
tara:strand:- start:44 stop:286 length:243 start_codon:yes stop_codon:yes gene_type:complete